MFPRKRLKSEEAKEEEIKIIRLKRRCGLNNG